MESFSKATLSHFCQLAGIKSNAKSTKKEIIPKIQKYLLKYSHAPRYLRNLSEKEKWIKMFEIRYYQLREKKQPNTISKKDKYKESVLDKSKRKTKTKSKKTKTNNKTKISKYTQKWNKKYKVTSLKDKSRISGVPLSILQKVHNKGLAAWRGSAHRPGAAQTQWGISRVNSFLTCGKTWYFPDHLLAQQAMKQSSKARNFWKHCDQSKMGKRTKSK
jgi:hypothetical protein